MNKIKDFFSNTWYSLINAGTGGMIIIWLLACAIYGIFFSVGGALVLPFTIIAFFLGFIRICIYLYQHRGNK